MKAVTWHGRRWIDGLMALFVDADVLGVEDFASHRPPLEETPQAYAVLLRP